MTTRHTLSNALRLLVVAPLVAYALVGCSTGNDAIVNSAPDPIASEPVNSSQPHNIAVQAALEELQQQVWDGDWNPAVGGNLHVPCDAASNSNQQAEDGNDFRFYSSWFTTDDYTAPEDPEATAQEFSSWLQAEGWKDVEVDSSDSPEYWRVSATQEDANVAEAVVTWYPTGNVDSSGPYAVLDVDSTCSPADTQD